MRIIRVAAGVIAHQGKILIGKRLEEHGIDQHWEFPGGKIEPGETPEACVIRELQEEFEIQTEVIGFVGESSYAYPHAQIELQAYDVRYLKGSFILHDHEEIRWVTIPELKEYPFAPADLPILRILEHRQQGNTSKMA